MHITSYTAESHSMLGLFCLYYMLTDTRFKADHKRIILTEVKASNIHDTQRHVYWCSALAPVNTTLVYMYATLRYTIIAKRRIIIIKTYHFALGRLHRAECINCPALLVDRWACLQPSSNGEARCREGSTGNLSIKDGTTCAPEHLLCV